MDSQPESQIPSPQVEVPIPPTPGFLETGPKKNFTLKFMVVVLAVLILGGGGYGYSMYLAGKNYRKVEMEAEKVQQDIVALKQKRAEDPFADWKTYRNEEYWFEFKYPANFEIQESVDDKSAPTGYSVYLRVGDKNKPESSWLVFELSLNGTGHKSLDEVIQEFELLSILKSEPYLNGQYLKTDGPLAHHYLEFDAKRSQYVNVVAGNEFFESEEFYKILSTFRFIETIVTFEQCVQAGNDVTKSFPETCTTKYGNEFKNWRGAGQECQQVITKASKPETGEWREFPTPCDVPFGWAPGGYGE